MTKMEELLERVEKAIEPDRFLGLDVVCALLSDPRDFAPFGDHHSANVTASLDAAVALVERVLPDREWQVLYAPLHKENGYSYAGIYASDGTAGSNVALAGKRPALALLATLLRALIKDQPPTP